jgi:hypothetical protein
MGNRVETCKRKARECERAALVVTEQAYRKMYLELAQLWHQIARDAEDLDRSREID